MARGRDEHRMVFDIRGRKGVVIKVVYVFFALLMVASLFLVTGALNIGTLFGNSSGESAVSSFQKQAAKIEAKLAKEPESEDLLASLTRTRINTANAMISGGAGNSQSGVEEVKQELAQMSEDWSRYLKAASKPSAGLAIQVSPALFQMAELSTGGGEEVRENVEAATEAQKIVAEGRPSLNALSTLSFYTLYTGDFKAAKEAEQEAIKLTNTKFERETFENQFEEYEKSARKFDKELKLEQAEKASKQGEASGGAGKEALEKPSLGGLGGATLGAE